MITDSDWWGRSATPCSLAAGHGLIRLDELHWHPSYLNDSVYLLISPLLPLPSPFSQPLALLLRPPTVQISRADFCPYVCACVRVGCTKWECCWAVSQFAARCDLRAYKVIFYWQPVSVATDDSQTFRHVVWETNVIQIKTHLSER